MRRGRLVLASLSLLLLGVSACAPPPRGALYDRLIAQPTATPAATGASLDQYYTLSAFRVADRLAAASNALDNGLTDRQQGRISAAYLALIAQRSVQSAAAALNEADQLSPPPDIRSQADHFYAAAAALATALDTTQRALALPSAPDTAALTQATQERQAAAQTLEAAMNALEAASWKTSPSTP